MKKNHLVVLTSMLLSAFSAQANANGRNITDQNFLFESTRFANKSFRLAQPNRGLCFALNNTNNPTRLVATSCDYSDETWANHRLQYVDLTIRTVKTFGGEPKCLTALGEHNSNLSFDSCNGSKVQQFDIMKLARDVAADTHAIINSHDDCFTNYDLGHDVTLSSCHTGFSTNLRRGFQLVDVSDPVRVRLINRGWYNMSFMATYNGEQWKPSWLALDGIRERYMPTYSHLKAETAPLKVATDFNRSQELNVEPGDFIEATAHGTTFDKSMKMSKKSTTAKLKIYSGYDYNGTNGLRFISDSVPNLMGFNDNIQSYKIPEGWRVRFFEEPNYQGRYYTRTASSAHDSHVDMNIKSIQILSK